MENQVRESQNQVEEMSQSSKQADKDTEITREKTNHLEDEYRRPKHLQNGRQEQNGRW